MLYRDDVQAMLKLKGVSQRELVQRSGLSESVVSTLIKQMPVLLPHLIDILGKNPYADEPVGEGKRMAEALDNLASVTTRRSVSDPERWQREVRSYRALPGRE